MKKGLLVQPWLPAGTAARRWLPLLVIVGMVLFFSMRATAGKAPLPTSAHMSDEVTQALVANGAARVLILLDDTGMADPITAAQQGVTLAQVQASVLNTVTPAEFQLYRQYQAVPGLAGTVTATGLAKLRTNPAVRTIQLDHPGGAHLQESVPALGGDVVHNTYGITGRGVTVAVLDSGVDTDHPDLAADLVAQQCFTNGSCPPSNTTQSANAEDANGHGTHVTGIITSKGAVSGVGFAPAAKIVAVRVLDANGSGFVSDWIKGLDWVLTHLATTPVKIVNLSLGTFALYTGNCDAQEALMATAVAKLRVQGVTLFASSGNQGAADRIASPACNSGVIAVG
ncbi:MAG: S8 family serine peptidase, partial [Ignavibacteria bacterium]|nr:S8 family serine peptidase [Ignavibacteria bacterium]